MYQQGRGLEKLLLQGGPDTQSHGQEIRGGWLGPDQGPIQAHRLAAVGHQALAGMEAGAVDPHRLQRQARQTGQLAGQGLQHRRPTPEHHAGRKQQRSQAVEAAPLGMPGGQEAGQLKVVAPIQERAELGGGLGHQKAQGRLLLEGAADGCHLL